MVKEGVQSIRSNKFLKYTMWIVGITFLLVVVIGGVYPSLSESTFGSYFLIFITLILIVSYIYFWISILMFQYKNEEYGWFILTIFISIMGFYYYGVRSEAED